MVAGMTKAGAAGHLDCLASKYAGRPVGFFGDAIPASFAETEAPVLCRIRPTHVVALNATAPTRRDREETKHMTGPVAPQTLPVPPSHLDLLTRPICGVFTTLGHDGQPQSTLAWVDLDRECALGEHHPGAAKRPQPARQPQGQPGSSSTPATPPGSSRSAASSPPKARTNTSTR